MRKGLPFIKKLEITTKMLVRSGIIGGYRSVFKGKGVEFEGYRNYVPTDDAKLIDWKASMRTGEILVRELVEERALDSLFLVDTSSSMLFGSIPSLKNEYTAELVATLSYAMLKNGDAAGVLLFAEKIKGKIVPHIGDIQFYNILHALVQPKNWGGGCDLVTALKYSMKVVRAGGMIVVVSDFIGLKGPWERYLKIARANFDVIGVMVRDERDKTIPKDIGKVAIADPFSEKEIIIDTAALSDKYQRYVNQEEKYIKSVFLKANCDFLSLNTSMPFIIPILKFFKERAKRWR